MGQRAALMVVRWPGLPFSPARAGPGEVDAGPAPASLLAAASQLTAPPAVSTEKEINTCRVVRKEEGGKRCPRDVRMPNDPSRHGPP